MNTFGKSERGGRVRGSCPTQTVRFLLMTALPLVPGCFQTLGGTKGTIEADVVPGKTADGFVFTGQRWRGTASVEAGHVYDIIAALTVTTGGAGEFDGIVGEVSGDPLAEPIEFPVGSSTGAVTGTPLQNPFAAVVDGEVTIEFAVPLTDESELVSDTLESLRALIRGPVRARYELLLTDMGFDDNGTSPEDAAVLEVGQAGALTGTFTLGDDADYFVFQVQAETSYELRLESTEAMSLTSGSEDRFGQVNFGVPTAGGLAITASASAGVPGIVEFTASATEEVLLRVTGGGLDSSATTPVQYAISVMEVIPEEP